MKKISDLIWQAQMMPVVFKIVAATIFIFLIGGCASYQPIPVEVEKNDFYQDRATANWWPLWKTQSYECANNYRPVPHRDCVRVEKRYYLRFSVPNPGPMPGHCWEKPGWPSCQLYLNRLDMYNWAKEKERELDQKYK